MKNCVIMFFIIVLAMSVCPAQLKEGTFPLKGEMVSGEKTEAYEGTCTLSQIDETFYKMVLKLGDETEEGIGILNGATLSCVYKTDKGELGVASYRIKGNVLDGVWVSSDLTKSGTETITIGEPAVELEDHGVDTKVSGVFEVEGKIFDGEDYKGECTIEKKGDLALFTGNLGYFTLQYKFNDGTSEKGVGIVDGMSGVLSIFYESPEEIGVTSLRKTERGYEGIWMTLDQKRKGTESFVKK